MPAIFASDVQKSGRGVRWAEENRGIFAGLSPHPNPLPEGEGTKLWRNLPRIRPRLVTCKREREPQRRPHAPLFRLPMLYWRIGVCLLANVVRRRGPHPSPLPKGEGTKQVSSHEHSFEQSIADKSATVGVIGLGYVGLPLIRAFVAAGFRTMGFDCDQSKVDRLLAGKSYIKHIAAEWIAKCVADGTFRPTADMSQLAEAGRPADLRPHAAFREPRPGPAFIEQTARANRQGPSPRPVGGPRKHDLSRHHPRRRPAHPRQRAA